MQTHGSANVRCVWTTCSGCAVVVHTELEGGGLEENAMSYACHFPFLEESNHIKVQSSSRWLFDDEH